MKVDQNITDFVTVDLFTPEECEKILKHCKKNYKLGDATINKGDVVDPEIRDSKISWLLKNDEKLTWVHDRIKDVVMSINEQKYNFDLVDGEKIQFTKYDKGNHYTWHIDLGLTPPSDRRKLSVAVNLTDNTCYDGGNLLLLVMGNQYFTIPPKVGEAVIFPSYIPHIVTEIEPKPGGG
tara:strand:+ start:407 stop:943 length:537 start_codon:yes stop_codon:yes gene_type:complete